MKIAAIDSSTLVSSIALMEDNTLICELNLNRGLTHSQTLMPLVDTAYKLAGWKPGDADIFAAVTGPGSFTGLRIGVATVKAIAAAHHTPVVSLNTLEVLAHYYSGCQEIIVSLLDARNQQVYHAAYDCSSGRPISILPPGSGLLLDYIVQLNALGKPLLFTGDGTIAYQQIIAQNTQGDYKIAPHHAILQRAGAAATLAALKAAAGETLTHQELVPQYPMISSSFSITK